MSEDNKYKAKPVDLPEPTYWPFFLAFGISLMVWGILTSWLISLIGLIVFVIALGGWISDLYHELKNTDEDEL